MREQNIENLKHVYELLDIKERHYRRILKCPYVFRRSYYFFLFRTGLYIGFVVSITLICMLILYLNGSYLAIMTVFTLSLLVEWIMSFLLLPLKWKFKQFSDSNVVKVLEDIYEQKKLLIVKIAETQN